jgi:hypothetical protein
MELIGNRGKLDWETAVSGLRTEESDIYYPSLNLLEKSWGSLFSEEPWGQENIQIVVPRA